jgi:hypothetical protein
MRDYYVRGVSPFFLIRLLESNRRLAPMERFSSVAKSFLDTNREVVQTTAAIQA